MNHRERARHYDLNHGQESPWEKRITLLAEHFAAVERAALERAAKLADGWVGLDLFARELRKLAAQSTEDSVP